MVGGGCGTLKTHPEINFWALLFNQTMVDLLSLTSKLHSAVCLEQSCTVRNFNMVVGIVLPARVFNVGKLHVIHGLMDLQRKTSRHRTSRQVLLFYDCRSKFVKLYHHLGPLPGAAKQNAGDQVEPAAGADHHPLQHRCHV